MVPEIRRTSHSLPLYWHYDASYSKLRNKKVHTGGTSSLAIFVAQCAASALPRLRFTIPRPTFRARVGCPRSCRSARYRSDTRRRLRPERTACPCPAGLAMRERKRQRPDTARCVTQCLSSRLSMPELRSEHFTFIRADARETPPVYLSSPT